MAVNFRFNNGGIQTDFDDAFIRREHFTDGGLWLWGKNSNDVDVDGAGRLGDNTIVSKSSPVQTISGGSNWKQVAAGERHTASVKTDGTLWLWGGGADGSLGNNSRFDRSSPIQTVAGGTNWKQVSAGGNFTAAVKTDGTLWLWGVNSSGQIGDNTIVDKSSPVQTVAGGTNWKQVSCGSSHTAAIKTDGTLWLWGDNSATFNQGKLGTNDIINRSSPVQTVAGGTNWKQVSAGGNFTAAVKTDGTLWLWGSNATGPGQLGDNTTVNKSSPVQTVAGGTNWRQVSAGDRHTAAIKTDGTLWLWGRASSGQLGDNTVDIKISPVQTISAGTNWKQVSAGTAYTACIKSDGTLWLWGAGSSGQLGDNTLVSKSSPVQTVAGGTNWKQVSLGSFHSACVKDDYS